ncbi:MAG: hypothetical protein WCI11_19960 [Candidatus Methylumidiphilus sp.]
MGSKNQWGQTPLIERLTPTISAPRHTTKPENTKPLRGEGALDRRVRL